MDAVTGDDGATLPTPGSDASQRKTSRAGPHSGIASPAIAITPHTPASSEEFEPSDKEDDTDHGVLDGMRKLAIGSTPDLRYHGKSSGHTLVRNLLDVKDELARDADWKGKRKMDDQFKPPKSVSNIQ